MDEIEGTGTVPNRDRVTALARQMGFAQIAAENAREYNRTDPDAPMLILYDAIHNLAVVRLAYDEAFARWAAAGFPD